MRVWRRDRETVGKRWGEYRERKGKKWIMKAEKGEEEERWKKRKNMVR